MVRPRFLGACLAAALGANAFGQSVVVPNSNASVAGGDTSGSLLSTAVSIELQHVYGNDQFASASGPIYITGFSFRAVPGTGPLSETVTGNIYLSTGVNYPNSGNGHTLLSTTFANNVGPDNTLVFSGSATINGPGCAAAGTTPCPWANNIVFATPFLYDPANGPLLIDTKATSLSGSGQLDVSDCLSATMCSTAGISAVPLGSPTATGNGGSVTLGGQVIQITYTPAPFFGGEISLGGGVYYLQFPNNNLFGYYSFIISPLFKFYHFDMGFEAFVPGPAADGYLYDFTSRHWFYTSTTLFPYLYDFTLNTWIYYFPDTKNPGHYTTNPRYFSNLTTGTIFTM